MKLQPFLLLVLVTAMTPQLLFSQPETLWTRTYGGVYADHGQSVALTSDNGYIVAGYTNSYGGGGYHVYLLKIDSNGDSLWARTYGETSKDYGYSVSETSDGGYIVTGVTLGAGGGDVYLLRTDSVGDVLWTRAYGGANYEDGCSVLETSDGGYAVVGGTSSTGAGGYDVYLLKTDSNGDSLWARTYGGAFEDYGYSVSETSDGGYIMVGITWSYGAGESDVYLIKTDSNGDVLWTRTYGGSYYEEGRSVIQTPDGGYVVAGWTTSYDAYACDVLLIRTDPYGDIVWLKTYRGIDQDFGNSVCLTSDGGYAVVGTTGLGEENYSIYLIKVASNGDPLWCAIYGEGYFNEGNSVAQSYDGGYIVTGTTWSYGFSYGDIYLVKTEPEEGGTEGIAIDIKPGSYPNSIEYGAKGVVAVAVLTTDEFDASSVDPTTVIFAGAQPLRWDLEDADFDGDIDLVFHFEKLELNLTEESTEATLTGFTYDGTNIQGTDSVRMLTKGKKKGHG